MKKHLILVGVVVLGAAIQACPGFVDSGLCADNACDGGSVDGAKDGEVRPDTEAPDAKPDADPPPPGCDTPNEPLKNPEKCLVDAFGAFVSPTGDDGADGSKARPFKTIGKALSRPKSRIVVCEGTYPETLDIQRDVEVYGGIACSFTAAGKPASIESGKATGLTVSRGTVLLSSMNVTAVNAVDPGESSIGVVVASGTSLKVVGGTVVAGTGAEGGAGAPGANYNAGLANSDPTIKGKDGSGNTPGGTQACAALCTEAPSPITEGGGGGVGGPAGGGQGADGKTVVPSALPSRGKGGLYDTLNMQCTNGNRGGDADPANGGAGATTPGTVEANKWTPSRGGPGQTARPGQGGGGGSGGASATVGGGGGGGCGGCGGGKGQGGQSGGSSFAVLSLGATVTLENVTLTAAAGGKGGDGGAGQAGQTGGAGGERAPAGSGCPGGAGGQGGQGGGGGGGAGGHSAAVAYTGAKPSLKSITPQVAATAANGGGPGATGAASTPATAGAPGKTAADLAL